MKNIIFQLSQFGSRSYFEIKYFMLGIRNEEKSQFEPIGSIFIFCKIF